MKHRQIHRVIYQLKHRYLTLNNAVIGVAFLIAAGWVWGSLGVMQRNYALQQALNQKDQELQLAKLETRSLELEREYYKTREYQELAVRERLGKGAAGEKELILPKDSVSKTAPTSATSITSSPTTVPSNLEQWMDFLFGQSR